MKNRVVFFGTSAYCLPILESLHKNFDLVLVVTRPDKPVGRKKTSTPSATKTWALKHHIPVATPASLKKDAPDRSSLTSYLFTLQSDLAVVSDFGLIIPQGIFDLPRLGTINIHFSKLPDLRGPSPVQFTLLRGDAAAWISIFKLENPPELDIKMDSGPILWQKEYPILPDDTTAALYTRLFQEAAKNLPGIIHSINIYQCSNARPQDHTKATFSRFITRDDGYIPWETLSRIINPVPTIQNAPNNYPTTVVKLFGLSDIPNIQQEALKTKPPPFQSAVSPVNLINSINFINSVYSFYRALTPWPGLWTIKDKRRMKILKCHPEENKLVLDLIQFEGEKPKLPIDKVITP